MVRWRRPAEPWRRLAPDAPRYQRVSLRGYYDSAHQFLLDNRSRDSVPGVEVLTPLVLDDGSAVIVNRGWLPFGPTRQDLPSVAVDGAKRNVVGRIDGTAAPGRYIVVSAHYDHIGVRNGQVFNGADDNASGTAALFALARHFSANRPRHSLIFAAFDAEESGLRGARHFVVG